MLLAKEIVALASLVDKPVVKSEIIPHLTALLNDESSDVRLMAIDNLSEAACAVSDEDLSLVIAPVITTMAQDAKVLTL